MLKKTTLLAAAALTTAVLVSSPAHADESPGIRDTARLTGAKVVDHGEAALVRFVLRCPRGDAYVASVITIQATIGSDDVLASGTRSGVCAGHPQQVSVRVENSTVDGSDYRPLHRGCGIEYGVTFTGPNWSIAFDRGGADGGPDGPGPALCFR